MGSIGGRFAEVGAVDGGHDVGGSVPDVFGEAVILVGPVGGTSSQYIVPDYDSNLLSRATAPTTITTVECRAVRTV